MGDTGIKSRKRTEVVRELSLGDTGPGKPRPGGLSQNPSLIGEFLGKIGGLLNSANVSVAAKRWGHPTENHLPQALHRN